MCSSSTTSSSRHPTEMWSDVRNALTVRRTLFIAVSGIIAVCTMNKLGLEAQAQTADTKPLTFEVASVKPNTSASRPVGGSGFMPGGRFRATWMTTRQLIALAYSLTLPDFQMSGGPNWIDSDHFDIIATAEGPPVPDFAQMRMMLRALLQERFELRVHSANKTLPIYRLVLAGRGGRLGPQLQRGSVDCVAAHTNGDQPPLTERTPCGMRLGGGTMVATSIPMSLFTLTLSNMVGRYVADRTGLTGPFDLDLTWTATETQQGLGLDPLPGVPSVTPSEKNGPSLFTALQEQLGLKLESTKGPVDVLVIDHVEQPTEN
jgi:uncharacterized protein (TIGR03435 family)